MALTKYIYFFTFIYKMFVLFDRKNYLWWGCVTRLFKTVTHFRPKYAIFSSQSRSKLLKMAQIYTLFQTSWQKIPKMSKIRMRFLTETAQRPYCLGQNTYIAYGREYPREVALLNHSNSNHEDDKV